MWQSCMQPIEAILFEPVGCLAEFSPEPFLETAAQITGRRKQSSKSGSRAYWHLLNVMEETGKTGECSCPFSVYDDVLPALVELKAIGMKLFITSSLPQAAIAQFLEQCPHEFDGVWSRDNAGGIKTAPIRCALLHASFLRRTPSFSPTLPKVLALLKALASMLS